MPRNNRPKPAVVPIERVPVALSEWRHLARSRLLSDRELYAAALTAYEAYAALLVERGAEPEKKWTEEEQRRRA